VLNALEIFPEPDGKVQYLTERVYKHEAQRKLMREIISQFRLGSSSSTRVGMVGFAERKAFDPVTNLNGFKKLLDFTADTNEIDLAIDQTTSGGNTFLQGAVDLAKRMLDTDGREGAQQLVVVLLDGTPTEWTLPKPTFSGELNATLEEIKKQATVMAVGYDESTNLAEIETIASAPTAAGNSWAFFADEISDIVAEIIANRLQICDRLKEDNDSGYGGDVDGGRSLSVV